MTGEKITDPLELRDMRIDNVKDYILNGLELDDATLSDLQANPEAYSDTVRVLGYKVYTHVSGILQKDASEGFPERYLEVIDDLVERLPDDSSLADMRSLVKFR